MSFRRYLWVCRVGLATCLLALVGADIALTADPGFEAMPLLKQFCWDCHGADSPSAGLNLQPLSSNPDMAKHFRDWRNVIAMVEQRKMPPEDAEQPNDAQRRQLLGVIRAEMERVSQKFADDPGPVTIRRLTSSEYAYTIRDLTGLDLDIERDFVSDAVGGEGFTNVGDAQFMQDSTLERYLSAAKRVADHAIIGAGPLTFYSDPGKTGFELSAISRIQNIYRQHGFRTAAGEGGEAFGLDRYSRAFLVAWQFRFREQLGRGKFTIATLARDEGIDKRFAEYIWSVLTGRSNLSFPISDIAKSWKSLPAPKGERWDEHDIRARCDQLQKLVREWQNHLGENPDAKEEARILEENSFDVSETKLFEMNVNWPKGTKSAHVTFAIESADDDGRPNSVVMWQQPVFQFRIPDKVLLDPTPFREFVAKSDLERINFGKHPLGKAIKTDDFATKGTEPLTVTIPVRNGATSGRLLVTAKLDTRGSDNRIIRCTISQREETDQGKSVSALLAEPNSESFKKWKDGVLQFARLLPQISHREPAPSDRDPIPQPFDTTYNNPQRNYFHTHVKYHRDDRFLVENILDNETRQRLDHAWFDLLGSFEYHDAFLRTVVENYKLDLKGRGVADLTSQDVASLPAEARQHVRRLYDDYRAIQKAWTVNEPAHVDELRRFAGLAWRRPLSNSENRALREFYNFLRHKQKLPHRSAIRALTARILMAPEFLYRAERRKPSGDTSKPANTATPLDDWELASRLSYFLWSSVPDSELRRAAAAGELSDPDNLARQAKRMLKDEKARRLASEFFGQWFGFYQFDRYRGVDPKRFPEFTDELKAAMHNEAVSLFEHIVRRDRPVNEILFGNYTFLNQELAKHYGFKLDQPQTPSDTPELLNYYQVPADRNGGLLSLAAVLTVTSAPRRTSPVKRGDWILRRVLGTPVPPPPADAGSIPADDVLSDGKTVRQRLEAHRSDAACQNCHSRIDPLGFTLEHFDAIGRWRDHYRDGQQIDSSGILADGRKIAGPDGLRSYLAKNQRLFHRTLCVKLVGYALGRSESISDQALIEDMVGDIQKQPEFSNLVDRIVRSKQFRFRR